MLSGMSGVNEVETSFFTAKDDNSVLWRWFWPGEVVASRRTQELCSEIPLPATDDSNYFSQFVTEGFSL